MQPFPDVLQKGVLKNFPKFLQENICAGVTFQSSHTPSPATLLKSEDLRNF